MASQIGVWFDQVGGRAELALDKLTRYESKHKISLLMVLGECQLYEISKA